MSWFEQLLSKEFKRIDASSDPWQKYGDRGSYGWIRNQAGLFDSAQSSGSYYRATTTAMYVVRVGWPRQLLAALIFTLVKSVGHYTSYFQVVARNPCPQCVFHRKAPTKSQGSSHCWNVPKESHPYRDEDGGHWRVLSPEEGVGSSSRSQRRNEGHQNSQRHLWSSWIEETHRWTLTRTWKRNARVLFHHFARNATWSNSSTAHWPCWELHSTDLGLENQGIHDQRYANELLTGGTIAYFFGVEPEEH